MSNIFSAEQYREVAGNFDPVDLKAWELDLADEALTEGRWNAYTLSLENRSDYAINALMKQILEGGFLSRERPAFSLSDLSYWTIQDDKVRLNQTVSYRIHQFVSENQVIHQALPKEEFDLFAPQAPRFLMCSSNIPHIPYPHLNTGHDLIKFFRDSIESSAPFLPHVTDVEWRYEGIHLYQKAEINYALDQLTKKGFFVTLHPPYVLIKDNIPSARQSISVQIPDGPFIDDDAVYQEHHTYKESLSVHNILVDWRGQPDKISLSFHSETSVEEVMGKISGELAIVAAFNPLVNRLACPVERLSEEQQLELVAQLKSLGYDAVLDAPFIKQQFVGLANGFNQNIYQRYVLIDLP